VPPEKNYENKKTALENQGQEIPAVPPCLFADANPFAEMLSHLLPDNAGKAFTATKN